MIEYAEEFPIFGILPLTKEPVKVEQAVINFDNDFEDGHEILVNGEYVINNQTENIVKIPFFLPYIKQYQPQGISKFIKETRIELNNEVVDYEIFTIRDQVPFPPQSKTKETIMKRSREITDFISENINVKKITEEVKRTLYSPYNFHPEERGFLYTIDYSKIPAAMKHEDNWHQDGSRDMWHNAVSFDINPKQVKILLPFGFVEPFYYSNYISATNYVLRVYLPIEKYPVRGDSSKEEIREIYQKIEAEGYFGEVQFFVLGSDIFPQDIVGISKKKISIKDLLTAEFLEIEKHNEQNALSLLFEKVDNLIKRGDIVIPRNSLRSDYNLLGAKFEIELDPYSKNILKIYHPLSSSAIFDNENKAINTFIYLLNVDNLISFENLIVNVNSPYNLIESNINFEKASKDKCNANISKFLDNSIILSFASSALSFSNSICITHSYATFSDSVVIWYVVLIFVCFIIIFVLKALRKRRQNILK